MATRRSEIQIDVLGLSDLKDLNQALALHDKRLQAMTNSYLAFNAAVAASQGGMGKFLTVTQTVNNTLTQVDKSVNTLTADMRKYDNSVNTVDASLTKHGNTINKLGQQAQTTGGMFDGMFGRMIQYRAIGLVFQGIQKSIQAVAGAMNDLQEQEARVARVMGGRGKDLAGSAIIESAIHTGTTDVAKLGEAFYQLSIPIKNSTELLNAYKATMSLVVAEESDAKDTARALVAIHAQFRDELDKTVPAAEQYQRIAEMISLTWKGGNLELPEFVTTLKYLGPALRGVSADMSELFAISQMYSELGMRGSQVGTSAGRLVDNIFGKTDSINKKLAAAQMPTIEVFKNPAGGMEVMKTLDHITRTMMSLEPQARLTFATIVGGSERASRALKVLDETATAKGLKSLEDQANAQAGKSREVQRQLSERTNTFLEQFHRSWNGIILGIGAGLDSLARNTGLVAILKKLADYEELLARLNSDRAGLETGTNQVSESMLRGEHGVRGAVTETNSYLAQAIGNMAALDQHRFPPGSLQSRGIEPRGDLPELDRILTEGMTPTNAAAMKARLRAYTENTIPGVMAHVQRDLDVTDAQLSNPAWGLPPRTTPSGSTRRTGDAPYNLGVHAKGLTPNQIENAGIIASAAKRYGLDPLAMIAVAKYESELDPSNKNPTSSATGLFQIMKGTAPNINRLDAAANAEFAAKAVAAAGGRGMTGEDAIRLIVDKFERPDVNPSVSRRFAIAEIAGARKFYRQHGGLISQSEQDRSPENMAAESDRALEARKTARDKAEDAADKAREKATAKADENNRLATDASEKMMDARLKTVQLDYAIAVKQHGVSSPEAAAAARAAGIVERATASPIELRSMQGGLSGTPAEQKEALKEKLKEWLSSFSGSATLPSLDAIQNQYAQGLSSGGQNRIDALRRNQRGNNIFADQDASQKTLLDSNVTIAQEMVNTLTKLGGQSQLLDQWQKDLLNAKAAVVDFGDTVAAKAYQTQQRNAEDAYNLRNDEINHLHRLKFTKDQNAADQNNVQRLSELIQNAQNELGTIGSGPEAADRKRQMEGNVRSARQNLEDFRTDARTQKYLNVYGQVKGDITNSLMNALHGQGSAGDVIRSAGDAIVNAALESQLKRFTDPLIQTVTGQILAIQGNTDALKVLTNTVGGGAGGGLGGASGGLGAVVAAGVVAGLAGDNATSSDAGLGKSGRNLGKGSRGGISDLQKGVGAALAAYSIGSTSAQQGVNLGNVLGGAATGASIGQTLGKNGGLIGAGIGIVVDLIGGLFHKKNKPTETPQNLNPSMYNAPAAFDLAAYNYSAYGKLPRMQDVGFEVKPTNVPVINVFVDGAKVAAQMEVSRQTSSVSVSLINTVRDRYVPL